MEVDITFKNLDPTEALKQFINERSSRLKKYFDGKMEVTWICYIAGDDHVADLKVHVASFEVFAQSKTEDLYKSIDEVTGRIESQLRKQKEMIKNHHHK